MEGLTVVRADYYPNGKIIPILIRFPDGSDECISSLGEMKWINNGREYIVCCTTPKKKLTLHFANMRWTITETQ